MERLTIPIDSGPDRGLTPQCVADWPSPARRSRGGEDCSGDQGAV